MENDAFLDGFYDDSSSGGNYNSYQTNNSYNSYMTDDDYEFFEGFDSYNPESTQSYETDKDYYETPEDTFLDQLVARTGFDSRAHLIDAWENNRMEEDFYSEIQNEVDWLMSQNVDFDTAIELIQNRIEQEAFEEKQQQDAEILELFDTILKETGQAYNGEQLDPEIFEIVKHFGCTLSQAYKAHQTVNSPFMQGMNSI